MKKDIDIKTTNHETSQVAIARDLMSISYPSINVALNIIILPIRNVVYGIYNWVCSFKVMPQLLNQLVWSNVAYFESAYHMVWRRKVQHFASYHMVWRKKVQLYASYHMVWRRIVHLFPSYQVVWSHVECGIASYHMVWAFKVESGLSNHSILNSSNQ